MTQPAAEPQPPKDRSALTLLSLIIVAAVMIAGGAFVVLKALKKLPSFGVPWGGPPPAASPAPSPTPSSPLLQVPTTIMKFSSYQEVEQFLRSHPSDAGSSYYRSSPMMTGPEMMVDELAGPMSSGAAPGLGATVNQGLSYATIVGWGTQDGDYSGTNVQVSGVDESDIVKTDGKYVYTVSGNNLFIVEAYPAEQATILAKIEFKSTPQHLFLNGDSLVVVGNNSVISTTETYKKFRRRSPYLFLKVFDIKDRRNPRQVRDLDFEGDFAGARMVGNYVYLLSSSMAAYYEGEPSIPRILENGQELPAAPGVARCNCPDVYYFDPNGSDYTYTRVSAVNVVNPSEAVGGDAYLMSAGQTVYMSRDHLYLAYTKRLDPEVLAWEVMRSYVLPLLPASDREQITKIEAVDTSILSQREKFQKISAILERWSGSLTEEEQERLEKDLETKLKERWAEIARQLETTVVHKIGIKGKDLDYRGAGQVPGYVLNQFALDEHEGYLRIATTRSRQWDMYSTGASTDSYSNLYVLDKDLKLVGKVEELAKGEQIFSVRFMQGRAYLVTFRQTDPLFVLDLKDPRNPRVLGELKVPGFSTYLHPYDETTLIGLGRETEASSWGGATQLGLKVSLFDVSDVANPKELDKEVLGDRGSDSIALNDHKAFLFSREKNLLVFPATLQEKISDPSCPMPVPCFGPGPCPQQSQRPCAMRYEAGFNGAVVFSVDKASGLTLRGKISHQPSTLRDRYSANWYNSQVKRSLYIRDLLYTLSGTYLKANRISDLGEVKNLELKKETTDDFNIVN
ncbi:MAG: copper amine oxidase-like protein [Parcubacteria group bacterium Gr01-1014_31]|nr:MAG: copper amine oxidase-like protein [Parcubacteria group bacterium Gr01-1014_31]